MSLILKSLQNKRGIRRYIGPKRIILLLGLIAFVCWAWECYRTGSLSPILIEQYRVSHPIGAVTLFILIYAISVIASLPSLPLNLAAGFFWGGMLGGAYSTLGVTIGGWVSFAVARWLIGQPLAENFDNKWAGKVQREFGQGGWKFVAFARINPIIPTGPLNYLLGLTSLSNRGFLWTTFIFLLPPSIAVAYIGDTLQTFTAQQSGVNEIVRSVLIISAAVTFLVGVKFAFKIFKKRKDE
ncbi:MAG: VTT domain-containing protein [Chloroflexi bacterium]|nr:VTT domain-containing protein [Chloroflexota bacterium]